MRNPKVYAWYFPNWHITPLNENWHGKGWTEWECVKHATPRFEGHIAPRLPLWGYEDESDPTVFQKKIRTAHDYGINGFIFDFYWFKKEGPYRIEALNDGFLKAKNNQLCEFSVMWCNHDPIYVHPASYLNKNKELSSGDVDADFFREVTDYCIKNYFTKTNYQRVDGKVYFGIYDTPRMIKNFGDEQGAAAIFNDFRARAKKAGFELHLAIQDCMSWYYKNDAGRCNQVLNELGIDSIFSYGWPVPEPKDWPKIPYCDFRAAGLRNGKTQSAFYALPYDVTVTTGWDSSPRTVQSDMYEKKPGYPFRGIVVDNTPEEIEKSFTEVKKFVDSDQFSGNIMTLSTWNEWTEGNFFEPDTLYGYAYLEAFKKIFRR